MIIGVTGKKGAGKDTTAFYIQKTYHYHKMSLADPIKQACNIIFGWSNDVWEHGVKEIVDEEFGISPRQAAQHLGTNWAQIELCDTFPKFSETTGRNLWANLLIKNAKKYDNVVVADVRFLHEVELIRNHGGMILKIEGGDKTDTHISEMEMELIIPDFTINNDGDFNELYWQIDQVVKRIEYVNKEN